MDALFNVLLLIAAITAVILAFAGARRLCDEIDRHWHALRVRARVRRELER